MNDFTKDELENIMSWAEVYTEFGCSWTYPAHKPLIEKIQSMLDNHTDSKCNHKEIVEGAYPRGNPPKRCDICEELYYE